MEQLTQIIQVTSNLTGTKIRFRLANLYGKQELIFQNVEFSKDETFHVKLQVTLQGSPIIKIPQGGKIKTDPLEVKVQAGEKIFLRLSSNKPQTYTDFGNTYDTTLTNAGIIRKADGLPRLRSSFTARRGWFCLDQVQLYTVKQPKVILFTGDSLIEMGLISDSLTAKLYRNFPEKVVALNSGISGNRVLHDAPEDELLYQTFGQGLLERVPKLLNIKPDLVFVFAGGNDLILPLLSTQAQAQLVSAEELAEAMAKVQLLVSENGGVLLWGDLFPFKLGHNNTVFHTKMYNNAQQIRRRLNQLVRGRGYVFHNNFVENNEGQLADTYDLGDHLHIGKEGGMKIAARLYKRVCLALKLY